jgi:oligopeptide/dipeptide ABC transporter ATP-binding protein
VDKLVELQNVKKYFPHGTSFFGSPTGWVKAVDGVSLTISSQTTFGLLGESGCGKSTLGRVLVRLLPITAGKVFFAGKDVFAVPAGELRKLRREMQIVFQDPFGSLNPRMTVGDIIGEPLVVHNIFKKAADRRRRVKELLEVVGLQPAYAHRYPHEFSGGQRQRIAIARALALRPRFIVCDEPVSALDVSIQSQIINLLQDLQEQFGLTYLFISHDLSVVKHICDTIAVMYLGKIVEEAPAGDLYHNPLHPYTQALMGAIPAEHPRDRKQRQLLAGDVPSPINPPPGCRFHTRCPKAKDVCKLEEPQMREMGGRRVACHFF